MMQAWYFAASPPTAKHTSAPCDDVPVAWGAAKNPHKDLVWGKLKNGRRLNSPAPCALTNV